MVLLLFDLLNLLIFTSKIQVKMLLSFKAICVFLKDYSSSLLHIAASVDCSDCCTVILISYHIYYCHCFRYYFSCSTAVNEKIFDDHPKKVIYPLKVRFNIINMQKKDALYNYGMKPATFLSSNVRDDWRHRGQDICYYKRFGYATDGDISYNKRDCYVLSFTYTFLGPVTVFFAHAFPYTYTDMKIYLASLEENPRIASILSRKELCKTILGNSCECVTITSKKSRLGKGELKPAIVISARIHPVRIYKYMFIYY